MPNIDHVNRDPRGHRPPGLPALIRLPRVKAITGLSQSEIYRQVAEGRFPKQVPLGPQSVAWIEAEVLEWVAARIADRDTDSPRQRAPRRKAS